MTDFINGHAFSEISTAASCRYKCGWTWIDIDMMDIKPWKFDPVYQIDFEGLFFEFPPLCPNAEEPDSTREWYAKNGTEKHTVAEKEWEWPVGEYKFVEEIEVS